VDSYPVYKRAKELDVFVKNVDLNEYEGWCWPGSSSWVDFFNPKALDWWKGIFKHQGDDKEWRWKKSTDSVFVWNDMNEPSVFNGPEITMPKDNIHHGGWEHRDVHNINAMLYVSTLVTRVSWTPFDGTA
jgi:mannosyl-oligosaccharide alpha-1,3-glucosidase